MSYIRVYIHYTFSTKNREPYIVPELENRLWAYMGGITKRNNLKVMAINGTEDHAHVLLSLPATITIANAIKLVKGASSNWVSSTFPQFQDFEWQKGYGAFSISHYDLQKTINYIKTQKKHHQSQDYKSEFLGLLIEHDIDYDEKYIWD